MEIVETIVAAPTSAHYLFSVEQKNVTQGLRTVLSEDGGRYMASEKQVSNNLNNSVLKRINKRGGQKKKKSVPCKKMLSASDVAKQSCTGPADSPVQVMDVVERWGLRKAHPCLPDVLTAVY